MIKIIRFACFHRDPSLCSRSPDSSVFRLRLISCLALAVLVAVVGGARLAMTGIDRQALRAQASDPVAAMPRAAHAVSTAPSDEAAQGLDIGFRGEAMAVHHSVGNQEVSRGHVGLEPVEHIRTVSGFPVYRRTDGALTTDRQGGPLPRGEVLLDSSGAELDVYGHILRVSTKAAPL